MENKKWNKIQLNTTTDDEDEQGPQSTDAIDATFLRLFPDQSNKIRNLVCHSSNIFSSNQYINIIISNIVEINKIKNEIVVIRGFQEDLTEDSPYQRITPNPLSSSFATAPTPSKRTTTWKSPTDAKSS
ncbi:hypothetical protein V8G54_036575, partial [Vigna mungo]